MRRKLDATVDFDGELLVVERTPDTVPDAIPLDDLVYLFPRLSADQKETFAASGYWGECLKNGAMVIRKADAEEVVRLLGITVGTQVFPF
jgi:hypothetical protein